MESDRTAGVLPEGRAHLHGLAFPAPEAAVPAYPGASAGPDDYRPAVVARGLVAADDVVAEGVLRQSAASFFALHAVTVSAEEEAVVAQ
jgi:hypothetical protein